MTSRSSGRINTNRQYGTFNEEAGWSETYSNTSNFERCRIIYGVKKSFLDKLDLILQKVNLEVLTTMETHSIKSFKLISMTELQEEISELFQEIEDTVSVGQQPLQFQQNTAALIKQNQLLRQEIASLNQKLQKQQTVVQQPGVVADLQQKVANLNEQIRNYEILLSTTPKFQTPPITPSPVASKLRQVQAQVVRLKTGYMGIRKLAKQLQLGFDSFRMDIGEKVVLAVVEQKMKVQSVVQENYLLKQELQNWQFDIQNYVQQKLQGLAN